MEYNVTWFCKILSPPTRLAGPADVEGGHTLIGRPGLQQSIHHIVAPTFSTDYTRVRR